MSTLTPTINGAPAPLPASLHDLTCQQTIDDEPVQKQICDYILDLKKLT